MRRHLRFAASRSFCRQFNCFGIALGFRRSSGVVSRFSNRSCFVCGGSFSDSLGFDIGGPLGLCASRCFGFGGTLNLRNSLHFGGPFGLDPPELFRNSLGFGRCRLLSDSLGFGIGGSLGLRRSRSLGFGGTSGLCDPLRFGNPSGFGGCRLLSDSLGFGIGGALGLCRSRCFGFGGPFGLDPPELFRNSLVFGRCRLLGDSLGFGIGGARGLHLSRSLGLGGTLSLRESLRLGGVNGASLLEGFKRPSAPQIPSRRGAWRPCQRRRRLSARRSAHFQQSRIDGSLEVVEHRAVWSRQCGDLGQLRAQRCVKVDYPTFSTHLGLPLAASRANGVQRLPRGSRLQFERPHLVESRNAFAQFLEPRPRALVEHNEKVCVKAWLLQYPDPSFDKLLRICVILRRFQQLLEVVEHEQDARGLSNSNRVRFVEQAVERRQPRVAPLIESEDDLRLI